jgi:hypothetical protein
MTPGETTQNPAIGLSDGNHLHAFFNEGARTIWYTDRVLSAPYSPPEPVPAPSTDVLESDELGHSVTETPIAMGAISGSSEVGEITPPAVAGHAPWFPVLVGGLSALGVVALIFLQRFRRGRAL